VNSGVNFESTGPRVALVAAVELTNKGFLSCVRQLVRLEVALCDEVLIAALAPEWTFSGVSSHVRLQVPGL